MNWTRTNRKLILCVALSFVLVGCSTVNTTSLNQHTRSSQRQITGFKPQLSRPVSQSPRSRQKYSDSTLTIVSRFNKNEVPHTLNRKPVHIGSLTSEFGYRLSPKGVPLPRKHKGVDYAAPKGTDIIAAGDGVVDKLYVSKSYGNYIRIAHDNGFQTAYAHMNEFASGLKVGSSVTQGQVIGAVGTTGRSSGDHLHFELIYQGKFIDPLFN